MIPLSHLLIFSAALLVIGIYGAVVRRNIVGILLSIELILNAAALNFTAFSRFALAGDQEAGVIFTLFIIAMAAAAAAVGLAIVIALFRVRKTIMSDEINLLKW